MKDRTRESGICRALDSAWLESRPTARLSLLPLLVFLGLTNSYSEHRDSDDDSCYFLYTQRAKVDQFWVRRKRGNKTRARTHERDVVDRIVVGSSPPPRIEPSRHVRSSNDSYHCIIPTNPEKKAEPRGEKRVSKREQTGLLRNRFEWREREKGTNGLR